MRYIDQLGVLSAVRVGYRDHGLLSEQAAAATAVSVASTAHLPTGCRLTSQTFSSSLRAVTSPDHILFALNSIAVIFNTTKIIRQRSNLVKITDRYLSLFFWFAIFGHR